MRLFLDSANLREVREVASWGVLSGVTTNPTSCAKEGVDIRHRVTEICDIVPGQVTASVVGPTRDEMVAMGRDLASVSDNVVVQFPVNAESLSACRILSEAGARVSMILVFSAAQAVLCANAGAAYCGPFVGRLDDIGLDGVALLEDVAQVFAVQGYPTEVLAMSLRSPAHVIAAARAGADIASIPYSVFLQMVSNPLTDLGSERFSEDWSQPQRSAESPGYSQATLGPVFEPPTPRTGFGFEQAQPAPYGEHLGAQTGAQQLPSDSQHTYDAGYGMPLPPGS